MATYQYGTNAELNEVAQVKVAKLTLDDPLFQIMPIVNKDTSLVMWEQEDNYTGLQQIRGYNNEFPKVNAVGTKLYVEQPGVYGEYEQIPEIELTERRQPGTFNMPVNIDDLIMKRQNLLLSRRIDRIRWIGWTLLTTGAFTVSNLAGGIQHQGIYSLQRVTRAVAWGTFATATPLADLRAVALKARAQGVSFGRQATAFMNQTTFNNMISNTNASDLYGRRQTGLATINNLSDLNTLMTGDNLPNIVIYDEVYITDSGTVTTFIPDGIVVIVGKRAGGQTVAEYIMTRNAQNPNAGPGPFMHVEDTLSVGKPPRAIRVYDGHNGGPAIYFPGSVVILTTT